jgi:hypothetical protein
MNKTIEKLRQSALAFCLMAAFGGIATAQNAAPGSGDSQLQTSNYVKDEQSVRRASDVERSKFARLTNIASGAFKIGKAEQVKSIAEALLKQAETLKDDWNYGNAIHTAHLVLGQIALNEDDIDEAKRHLLEAGKTPGSPQLNTFGPNMILAKNLLEKKERETVLKYFELCAKFWKDKDGKLNEWKAAVVNGEVPDFGANLRY